MQRRGWIAASLLGIGAFSATGVCAAAPVVVTLQGHPAHTASLKPLIDAFNASQDQIQVKLVMKEPTAAVIAAEAAAGTLPDLIESAGSFTQDYAAQGLLVDLDPLIKASGSQILSDELPSAMDTGNAYKGGIYSLPSFLQIEGGYYNTQVLAAVGVAAPQPGWTWADLKTLAQKSRQIGADNKQVTWGAIAPHPLEFDIPLLGQAGGALITSDLKVTADSEPVHQVYDYLTDMLHEGLLSYRTLGISKGMTWDVIGHHSAFVAAATYRQNEWDQIKSPMVTAPPLRQSAGSQAATSFTTRSWALMKTTSEKERASWRVVQYLLQPDVNAKWCAALGYPPATKSAIASSVFHDYIGQHQNMAIWAEAYTPVAQTHAWPDALTAAAQAAYLKDVPAALKLQESVPQFIGNLQTHLQAVVQEYLKKHANG